MSGTVAQSVTDATLLFTKTKKKLCKHITEKCSIMIDVTANVVIISSTVRAKE